jgi:hypothetical protein
VVWPPRHTQYLSRCSLRTSYADTAHSLSNVDGVVWFVQKTGETVVLPKDLAHSTFIIQSYYLLTSSCLNVSLARVLLISSDVAAGTTKSYAATRLVDTVEAAVQRLFNDSRPLMQNFWSENTYNMPSIRRDKTRYSRFSELLTNHMHRERRCISCMVLSVVPNYKEITDPKRHISLHTNYCIPAAEIAMFRAEHVFWRTRA